MSSQLVDVVLCQLFNYRDTA